MIYAHCAVKKVGHSQNVIFLNPHFELHFFVDFAAGTEKSQSSQF